METVTSIAKGFALRNQAVATMSTSSPPVREEPRPLRRSQMKPPSSVRMAAMVAARSLCRPMR